MKHIKISVIGAGHLGKFHLKLLASNQTAELIGVYDINTNIAQEQATLYNIKCFANVDDAINESDVLFLIVPTTEHYRLAKKILNAGKHLFIEKPVCSDVAQAKELLAIANDNPNIKIQIGHIERFNSAILISKKYPLQPKFIESHRLTQYRNRGADVSVVHDLMIHDIDLAL